MLKLYYYIQSKIQSTELKLSSKIQKRVNEPYSSKLFYFNLVILNQLLVFYQIFGDLVKYLIILTRDPGLSFNIFFRQKELRSCPFSYSYYKTIQAKVRIFSLAGATTIILVAILSSIITNLIFGGKLPSWAAQQYWIQNNWSTASTTAIATSAASGSCNVSGTWSCFLSKDSIVAATTSVQLALQSATSTQTTDTDFNFGATSTTAIVGTSTVASVTIQADNYTKLLVEADGSNNSTVFTDKAYNHTLTSVSGATISNSQVKFGTGSARFDVSNYDYVNTVNSTDWDLGSSDFTFDMWVYLTTNSIGRQPFFSRPGGGDGQGYVFYLESNNYLTFVATNNNGGWNSIVIGTSTVPPINTWVHLAVVRYGNIGSIYENGVLVGSATFLAPVATASNGLRIGHYPYFPGGQISTHGYIDEFRFSNGIARWTTNFTPPTSPYNSNYYFSAGTYLSPTIDFGNKIKDNSLALSWNQTLAGNGGSNQIGFLIATSSYSNGPWNFYGPLGTSPVNCTTTPSACYSNNLGSAITNSSNARYVKYKTFFNTNDNTQTPSLDSVSLAYSNYYSSRPLVKLSFEDAIGSIATGQIISDSSGNNNYATSSLASSTFQAGVFGQSFSADNSLNGYNFLNSSLSSFSLSAWFRTNATSSGNQGTIVALGGPGGPESGIGLSNGAVVARVTYDGYTWGTLTSATSTYNDNNWHHTVLVYDNTTHIGSLYVDGQFASSTLITTDFNPVINKYVIGSGTGAHWGGLYSYGTSRGIDEVQIYDHALTTAEVQILYTQNSIAPTLTSSIFNSASPANMLSNFSWAQTLATNTSITFQIRTATSSTGIWTPWLGSDGTTATYFTTSTGNTIPNIFKDYTLATANTSSDQFVQYKAFFYSDGQYTPTLSSINLAYLVNAPPEGSSTSTSPTQSASGTVVINFQVRDIDTSSSTNNVGFVWTAVQYCTDYSGTQSANCPDTGPGNNWATTSLASLSGFNPNTDYVATDTAKGIKVTTSATNQTAHTLIWDSTVDATNLYNPNFKIRLLFNDGEIVNNLAYATTTTFLIDTTKPAIYNHNSYISVDASNPTISTITAYITENSPYQIKYWTDSAAFITSTSNLANLVASATTTNGWLSYNSTTTIATSTFALNSNSIVFAAILDSKGNLATTTATVPTTIVDSSVMIQDTSNLKYDPGSFNLFLAWQALPVNLVTGNTLTQYNIYRSIDKQNYNFIGSSTALQNYFSDTSLSSSTFYYYKIAGQDDKGNVGYVVPVPNGISGNANGLLDPGEGGTPGGGGVATSTEGGIIAGLTPIISNVSTSSLTTTGITVKWHTANSSLIYSNSQVAYATTPDFSDATTTGLQTLSSDLHTISLYDLTPNTTYYFEVISTNPVGGTAMATSSDGINNFQFTTSPGPVIDVLATTTVITNTAAIIYWHTTLPANSYVVYSTSSQMNNSLEFGLDESTYDHTVTIPGLIPNTPYFYYVKSADADGNRAFDTNQNVGYYNFTTDYDHTAPVVIESSIAVQPTDTQLIITYQTNEPASTTISYGTTTSYTNIEDNGKINNFNIDHQIILSSLTPGETYHFQISVTDQNGNTANYTDQAAITDIAPDITAPIIQNPQIVSTGKDNATLNWTTDEPATGFVQYAIATTTNFETNYIELGNSELGQSHSININGLTQGQRYYFRLKSTDRANNTATSSYDSFLTQDGPNILFDQNTQLTVNQTSATFSWTTDVNSDGYVIYSPNSDFATSTQAGETTLKTNHTVILNGLTPDTTYYFKLKSTVANGASSLWTNPSYHFQTGKDITPPTIINLITTSTTENSAVIQWGANELALAKIDYGVSQNNYTQSTGFTNTLNYDSSFLLSDLASSTTYYYQLTVKDENNNLTTSTEHSFVTTELKTSKKQAEQKQQELQQQIDQLNQQINQASSTNQSQTIDLQKQLNDLQVQLNEQKNKAGGGVMIVDKTDKTAPIISNIQTSDLKSDSVTVSWDTNEDSYGFVDYGFSSNYDNTVGLHYLSTKQSVKLKNLEADKNYHYRISVLDSSGNLTNSTDLTFTTPSLSAQLTAEGKTPEEIKQLTAQVDQATVQNNTELLLAAAKKAMDIVTSIADTVSLGTLENTLANQFDTIQKLANAIPAPVMGGEPGVVPSATSATIAWRTDKDSSSMVALAPDSVYTINADANRTDPYARLDGDNNIRTKVHLVKVTDLKPETTYHYQLRSKADLGPESKSRDFTFTTRAETLEVTNYAIQNLTTQKATFRWLTNIETDSQVTYIPYRNNKLAIEEAKTESDKTLTTIHEITVDDLEGGTIYQIELSGKDAKGNQASKVIETYSTSKDTLPPTIFQVQTESALSQGKDAKVQTIISWMTDKPTLGQIMYDKGINPDTSKFSQETALETNYTKRHVAVITKFDSGAVYSFKVNVIDSAGNQTTSNVYTILTPRQKESVFQLILKNFESTFGWVSKINGP